jgi:AcrR family transcriptional regulator
VQNSQDVTDALDAAAAPVGARQRRKRAVSASIERIAVDLALELGVDGVTIEMICDRALISHRTFYNYFPTKEAALFGALPEPSPERLSAFRDGTSPDVLGDLLELLAATAFSGEEQERLFRDRGRLLKKEPQLVLRAVPKSDKFFAQLTELTLDRLTGMARSAEPVPDLRDRAAMVVTLATAVMHRSLQMQMEADDDTTPRAVLDHSISLARQILSEGQKR